MTSELGPGALVRGASIGRYVVLGMVGRGGMGEVYAAYDPELDRKVAVKLLRVRPGNGVSFVEGRQRTLREAQAIARLQHPNVVVVYDVGTFQDQVFIAMEFVEGTTLSMWLHEVERSWREVLKVFVAAGRGLLAAHDKGLVHRDFKPDNVMVGRDDLVRVMDFGLARQVSAPGAGTTERGMPALPRAQPDGEGAAILATLVLNGPPPAESESSSSGAFEVLLTRPGAMMGTPAYMAPEQFLGTPTDARTDQFSFCVALYEALYGERPFSGQNMIALTANVVQGHMDEVPAMRKVPPWLRRVLVRGLSPDAGARYPSMKELLAALERDPAVGRRRAALAGAALVLPLLVGLGVRQTAADHQSVCGGAAERLTGIWEVGRAPGNPSPRQEAIRKAFMATGKTYAADAFASVSRVLTGYAQGWAGMYREACEATHVRGEQSAEVLDLRMSCLQDRLSGLRALTHVFTEASGEVVENAVGAANALSSLDRCADVALLRSVVTLPEDPAARARVAELRRRVADVKALFDSGRWHDALVRVRPIAAEVRVLGYQPLLAETLAIMGNIQQKSTDVAEAERTLVEALWAADASRHDEVRAEVATNLVWVAGTLENEPGQALRWAKTADAILQRLGGHELLQAWLLNDRAGVYNLQGKLDEAVRANEEALALKEKALGPDHPDVGISEGNLAIVLGDLGRNQEALAHLDRAVAVLEKGYGADHPDVATQLSNRGEVLNALGRHREARASFERALIIWERELGLDHRNLAYPLTGLGESWLAEGDPQSALAPLERAFKIREAEEKVPSRRAATRFALARALWEANRDRRRARELAAGAREMLAKASSGPELGAVDAWLSSHGGSVVVASKAR
jgi:tetratricopeptide (TPR) repeat protein